MDMLKVVGIVINIVVIIFFLITINVWADEYMIIYVGEDPLWCPKYDKNWKLLNEDEKPEYSWYMAKDEMEAVSQIKYKQKVFNEYPILIIKGNNLKSMNKYNFMTEYEDKWYENQINTLQQQIEDLKKEK